MVEPNDCSKQPNNCEGGNCFAGVVPLSLREQSVKTRVNTYHPTTTHHREELTMFCAPTKLPGRVYLAMISAPNKTCRAMEDGDDMVDTRIVKLTLQTHGESHGNPRISEHQGTRTPEHPSARAQEYLERSTRSTLCPQLFGALFIAPWSDLSGLGAALRRASPTPEPITNQYWHASTPV
jgi:hypothetical protein